MVSQTNKKACSLVGVDASHAQSGFQPSTGSVTGRTIDDATVLPQSGFLTAEFVKRRYSISNSTLYAWLAAGKFVAPRRIGLRAVRWRAEDLRAFEETLEPTGR